METIKSYISILIVVSISAGAVNVLAPDGNIKKYIKYLISLSVIIILLLPFKDLTFTLPKILNSYETEIAISTSAEDLIVTYSIAEIKNNIKTLIKDRFNITVDVKIDYNADDYENVTIEKITVYSKYFADDIKRYLSNMMYCEIEVVNDG
jgi:Stage III sporulation protein AF (Spore_III_AF).